MKIRNLTKSNIVKKGVLPLFAIALSFGVCSSNKIENDKNKNDSNSKVNPLPDGDSQQERFINSLKNSEGFEGNLDLSISLKDKGDSTGYSTITTSGASLRLARPSQKVLGLDLNATLDYNGVSKSAHINYVNDVAYFDCLGLTYKYSDTTYKDLTGEIISIFGVDALKVPDSIYDFIDSFMKDDESLDQYTFEEEKVDSGFAYKLSIGNDNYIHLTEDENYNLTSVYSDKLTFDSNYLSFKFATTRNDDELTEIKNLIPENYSSYKEVYNSMNLVRKIHNLTSSPKFGISINGTLHHEVEETNHHTASEEDIALDGDISLDINNKLFSGSVSALPSTESVAANSISFLSNKEDETQKTYLNYNNVMKVAVTDSTLNEIVNVIKEDFGTGLNVIDKFLTLLDDSFVSNIKKGHYESFVDSIKSLSNDDNLINLSLNLETFGFGTDSSALIKIDGNSNNNLVSITLNNAGLNGFYLNNTNILLTNYSENTFSTEGFYFLEKVPGIIDQIYDIYNAPKFHLAIEGSYVDSNGVGLSTIKGEANLLGHTGDKDTLYEFDSGYFDLKLAQQVGVNNSDGTFNKLGNLKNHHVSLDLEKLETAYFHYYDEDLLTNSNETGTYGKLSIEPYQDVIDIIKEIYNSNDPRFSKWFKVVASASSSSVIDAIKTGRYSPILATNLVVSSTFSTDYAKLVLSGSAFGFNDETNENNFSVTFTYDCSNIKTLSIENLVTSGKTLNLKITLSDYDETKTTCVDHDKTTTDFTGFAPLISDLYNTANLKTYRLSTSDLGLSLIGIDVTICMDFRIYVDGSIVKVYGKINVPVSMLYSNTYNNGIFQWYSYRNCVFYFDDINPDTGKAYEDNSGYAYLTYNLSGNKTEYSGSKKSGSYKYYSTYFQDTTNLMTFIFSHIMDLKSNYVNSIINSINKTDESKDAQAINFEKLITNFSYDETNRVWDIGIAVQYLLKDDTLKNMKVKIYSTQVNSKYYLSKFTLSCTLASIVTISGTITNENIGEDNWTSINDTYNSYIESNRSKTPDYK